jgi:hypothetical protein
VAKKEQRGLPPEFDLNLPSDKPVQLGDYLDEDDAIRRPPKPRPVPETPPYTVAYQPAAPAAAPYLSRQQLRPGSVPRKQLNATPETIRMLDELLVLVRQQSMEKDIRTSELFHAMVLCIYESRANLDLGGVQPRGRWGSPTAASLPVALKNAFMDAVTRTRAGRK